MSAFPALSTFLCRWRKWLIAATGALVLHAILGFLVLPMVLKRVIPEQAGRALGRAVSLERVRTNPFTLSITIDGFQVKDPDGSALLDWNRLYVNAELWPLLRKRLDFKVIDLDRPRFHVVLEKGGRLNFSDILDRLSKPAAAEPSSSEPMELAVDHLRVAQAQLAFLDRSLPQPFSSILGPITIDLERFRTERDARSPYAFKGRTEAGETFVWDGTVGTQPLKSAGVLELSGLRLPKYAPYYQDQVAFRLESGLATAKASYEFEWSEKRHAVRIMDGSIALQDLALHEKEGTEPSVKLPSIQASGLRADLLASTLEVGAVSLKDGTLQVRRNPDGTLNLQTMFTPPPQPEKPKSEPFKVNVGELALDNFGIQFEDRVPTRPVSLSLDHIRASLKDLSLDPAHDSALELGLRIGEKGLFEAKGTVGLLKPAGDLALKLDGLDLVPLDAYLDPVADMRFTRGRLGLEGRLRFAMEGKKSDGLAYRGDVQVSEFEARDAAQNEPFLRWKRLRLLGSDVDSRRPSVILKRVEWDQPEGRLVMARDGASNVARALKMASPSGPVAAVVPPPTPQEGPQPLVRIARMGITGGRLSFIDRSVEPNAALLLSDMEGVYTGLSTEAEEATLADFKGKAGGIAPITIKGKAMPLRHDKDTDVSIRIEGADLTDFSPYTGKYLGYTTRQGKLDVEARVRIQDRKLNIEDRVKLDRWYLGDKVDSPDATHLPVKLGLAILRDRKGLIELEVPIDGSLDEPNIHYGKMVWKAILNVFGKIITSPFTLLSKMFGGGDADLSSMAFLPGSSDITPPEQKKVETLVKALVERPELRLELEATTDAQDARLFKQRGLERLLKQAKWNARKVKTPATPEEEVIDPGEREQWLRVAFDAAFPPPKGAKVEPAPLAEVEQRMLDTVTVDPNELRALADARNKSVLEALLKDGQVEPGRVFVVQGSESARAGGTKLYFSLK